MIRELFIKYLTQDSETRDARRKEFNQAIFDAEKGFANYCGTDLDMVLEKFDKALAGFCAEIEKMELSNEEILKATQVAMLLPDGKIDSTKGYLAGRQQVAQAQLQKILNKLRGAE